MLYLDEPYYHVYEVIIYWKNSNNQLRSFYKIGLIKVEREDRKLNYRYRKEIEKGCKVFVINQIKFDNYYDTSKMEEAMLKIAKQENLKDFLGPEENIIQKYFKFDGDLEYYPHYFAGSTEAFKTPKRLSNLILKLNVNFEKNPDVFYPIMFNNYLLNNVVEYLKNKKPSISLSFSN